MDHSRVAEAPLRLCFVCLGNICRSPTAEGVMLHLVERVGLGPRFQIDSAGTADYHVGKRADPRTLGAAQRRGVALPSRARQFEAADFERFDYVLAMDGSNLKHLRALARTDEQRSKVHLLRTFEPGGDELDVPDPYYGGAEGFESVLDICEAACAGLLQELKRRHGL